MRYNSLFSLIVSIKTHHFSNLLSNLTISFKSVIQAINEQLKKATNEIKVELKYWSLMVNRCLKSLFYTAIIRSLSENIIT